MHIDWPRAFDGPLASAHYRAQPEHFRVQELADEQFSGSGDYLYLKITKHEINTAAVASELCKFFKVKPRAVSYAGRKDKFAVTTQWFCVHLAENTPISQGAIIHNRFDVEAVVRHNEKLAIGELRGNQFTIQLSSFVGDRAAVEATLARLQREGFPNYFGPQRFGSKGQNIIRGKRMLAGTLRVRDKNQRSMYLSACRSYLFNEILAERVRTNTWRECLPGDIAISHTTEDPGWLEFSEHFENTPMGYIPGDGDIPVAGAAADIICSVFDNHETLYKGIKNSRSAWHERPLAMQANDLSYNWYEDQLELTFSLPKGAFATSLLRELIELDSVF